MSPILLSSHGLQRAASVGQGTFTFLGDGCKIECTQFQAAFISPRVHRQLQEDKTLTSFFIDFQTPGIEQSRAFTLLERLLSGFSIAPADSEVSGLSELATDLGNSELISQLLPDESAIDKSNVLVRLRRKSAAGLSIALEIDFAASHFYEIEVEGLKGMDISIVEGILSSESLRLGSEDSLLDFICSLESVAQFPLVRYLRLEYLSADGIVNFLSVFSDFICDPLVWSSVCDRLRVPFLGRRSEVTFEIRPGPVFSFKRSELLDGMIRYLTKKHGGNVDRKRVVMISSNTATFASRSWPSNAADFDFDSYFPLPEEPGRFIRWDFGQMRVRPTHDVIQTTSMRSWVVEGSVNGESWIEIDRQTDNDHCALMSTHPFPVTRSGEFRFVRLTQTHEGSNKARELPLYAVEFFGTLCEYGDTSSVPQSL
jgi:hypothetical protein